MLKGHHPAPDGYAAFFQERAPALPGHRSDPVRHFRQTAFERFARSGLPGARAEEWKYTPAINLLPKAFGLPAGLGSSVAGAIRPYLPDQRGAARIVFVDGRYEPHLSDLESAGSRMHVGRIAELLDAEPEGLLERIREADRGHERSLDALNAALLEDGCLIRVEAGEGPAAIQIVTVVTGRGARPGLHTYQHLVSLAPDAEAHLTEIDVALADDPDVVNRIDRIELGERARLVHERVQVGALGPRFLSRLDVALSADSRLTHNVVTVGGGVARNEVAAVLAGSGIEATFNGLYLAGTGQHVDNALNVRHAAPGSMSDQFYKGVLDGKARSAFAGRIVVDRIAQKTNAYQSNNNLLLSPDAEINTKPELEIYADDVKCSHGATAGELDERALFYLRSRGLEPELARNLLTYAFAGEVLERLVDPAVKRLVQQTVLSRLGAGVDLGELVG